ncbi:MAG: tetratricopeptide repeat protein, partial [Myxococcota bacterium]|nr:tetratricopeptide repeat protein [Myxococcota bacterium]
DQVLVHRAGLPILLSVVYMEVARRVGGQIDGISFPGHFVVRPTHADPPFYVDPYNGGAILRTDALRTRLTDLFGQAPTDQQWTRVVETSSHTNILGRLCNNLKRAYLAKGDTEGALRAVERLILLRPDDPEEVRDRGLLKVTSGLIDEGTEDLAQYVASCPDAPDANAIARQIADLTSGQVD